MTLSGNRGHTEVIIKMKPLGWTLIQHDWCPYKKGKLGHKDMHRGQTTQQWPHEDGGKTGAIHLQLKNA